MPLNLLPMVKHALHRDSPDIYRLAHSEDIVCRIKIALTVYNFDLDEALRSQKKIARTLS